MFCFDFNKHISCSLTLKIHNGKQHSVIQGNSVMQTHKRFLKQTEQKNHALNNNLNSKQYIKTEKGKNEKKKILVFSPILLQHVLKKWLFPSNFFSYSLF